MTAEDFIYDGIQLSSFGLMIGYFDGPSDLDGVDTDSQRTFNNFSLFGGKWQPLSVSTYRDTLRITMSIIRNPCDAETQEDMVISLDDIRKIKRWLNRPDFHELRLVDPEFDGIFWNGSCNVEEVHAKGKCVGFNLTFDTDRPFALADPVTYSGSVEAGGHVAIDDISDEIGYIYPDVEITLRGGGDFSIHNSMDDRTTLIKNCTSGETITVSKVLVIESSLASHKIMDDFNWKFLRIGNTYSDRINMLTFSNACEYKITYNPIVKAVIA